MYIYTDMYLRSKQLLLDLERQQPITENIVEINTM